MKNYSVSDSSKAEAFFDHRKKVQLRLARRRISAAIRSGAKKLDLSYLELTEIPKELHLIKDIEELILSNNRLGRFPNELTKLSTLRKLYVVRNGLTEIPSEIEKLKELRHLDFGSNSLKQLPTTIGQLHHLKILACRSNELKELPDTICDLENLECLWLRENRIGALPERIGKLTKLKDLDLRDNSLSRLPKSMGQLGSLAIHAKIEEGVGYGLVLDRNPLFEPIRTVIKTTVQPETTIKIIDYLRDGSIKDVGSVKATAYSGVRFEILPAYTMALGIRNGLTQEVERLHSSRPNTVTDFEKWSQKIEILKQLESSFNNIIVALSVSDGTANDLDAFRQTSEVSVEISNELKQWISVNKMEVIDWFFRLPVATMMIGLLNYAGANMVWATPVVLAAVGGKPIRDFIKDIASSVKPK